ncbi:radical SAM family RiPP maturation amino acid epimerase (plasmid) [Kovacikia minuta CCNUW1]|uniref:radical SAM family RiPP maturation amino acid epimerase n=1 Tax=Kovacikia minuta TaxID=2931930 RepID=UPI001CCA6B42|nr:radical SAM family RiPP maturation amino acid epimerase [Kovacikia minuta]UBF30473.1 radical SAM family RiPP maturation amino acid epimerase [Kovacikia minuta CCNUW1]
MINRNQKFVSKLAEESSLSNICNLKRFSEKYHADPNFREEVALNLQKTCEDYNFEFSTEEIGFLRSIEFNTISISDFLERYRAFKVQFNALDSIKTFISDSISNPHYKSWRERQISRTKSQFKKHLQDAIVHAPVCFELTKGCSVGCWFCGVSALRLSDIFHYTEENSKLWREVLEVVKQLLGPAAGAGFCYWATDPLDNPDYENFCVDFHQVMGMFPQTTTSQPLKDPMRIRALLKLSQEKGCPLNRFSVLSLKILNQIHAEFSAEELALVELVLQNEESGHVKANAGRSRVRNLKQGENDNEFHDQGTIACVTGFLFNMVERSVKLISPCNASDQWPLGYIVYDEGTFSDAGDLKLLLERMIEDNMPLSVKPSDRLKFRHDLEYASFNEGFQVFNRLKTIKFRHAPYLKELGEAICTGDKTVAEIISMFEADGVLPTQILRSLNLIFERGVLDNEPQLTVPKFS